MNSNEIRSRLESDPDFIASKRFDYSLDKLLERYPDGAPSKVIAQALMVTEEELLELETRIISKIRAELAIEVDQ